ncbi:MAG TPA: DUF1127 domain-containing protein [Burkholderiaceae bacterium]|nr:DUF1127 domain-containing protein [Burkholderiaceae bacterium]
MDGVKRNPDREPGAARPITAAERIVLVGATLRLWRQWSRSREELTVLDERALRDLGMSSSQAAFEAGKPFWRA